MLAFLFLSFLCLLAVTDVVVVVVLPSQKCRVQDQEESDACTNIMLVVHLHSCRCPCLCLVPLALCCIYFLSAFSFRQNEVKSLLANTVRCVCVDVFANWVYACVVLI